MVFVDLPDGAIIHTINTLGKYVTRITVQLFLHGVPYNINKKGNTS